MKYTAENFYNYFKECYQLDHKEFQIENILSSKHSYKWFEDKTEKLISRRLPITPYFNNRISDLQKEIELYHLEKKLLYGAFFILGKKESSFSKDLRFCAPLFLFPASIKTIDDEAYLTIERAHFQINPIVLSKLELVNTNFQKESFIEETADLIQSGGNEMIHLKRLFDKYFSNINTEELLLFPTVWSVSKIRRHLSSSDYSENQFKIIPAAGTVFVEKSESSLKVINDLNTIAKKGRFNNSLKEILVSKTTEYKFHLSYMKSRLNNEQFHALQNAYRFNNSVIVGPPGTGKTYTITSIITDAITNNQSVLVVSKTKQAVEVLRKMLQDDFNLKKHLVHTTGINYKRSLKSKMRKYLSGMSSPIKNKSNETNVRNLYDKLDRLEKRFEKFVDHELKISDLEFSQDLNLLEKWKKYYLKANSLDIEDLWSLFSSIDNTLYKLENEIATYTNNKIESNVRQNFQSFRKDIAGFFDALDANSFSEYKGLLKDVNHNNILKVFPVWLANLSDLNSILPLKEDLFDLVIIDEATQCDIASSLPALYRSKRAIVVGDPHQLRHYSFVSQAQQQDLRKKYQLSDDKIFDYRNRSVLDLFVANINRQEQITFLKEHFRSTPSLIEFSNQEFYDGQLNILKSTPKDTSSNQIEIINTGGLRNTKGVNEIEAIEIVNTLSQIILKYKNQNQTPTIGIITPFSKQATFINQLLKKTFSLEILKKFKLLCGTPYHFQGSERDIVCISFTVCNKTHPSVISYLNKPEMLNVAVTRAKSTQIIFKSITPKKINSQSLFFKYLDFAENFYHQPKKTPELDEFQNEVVFELEKRGVKNIYCGYPLAGSVLDILISKNQKNYFIDLIGYPGMFKEAFELERYKTLARTAVISLPLHYTTWQKNRDAAVNKIISILS